MRRAWILSTGTELVLGQSVDTNSAWLAAALAGIGIRTERHVTVPDDLAAIHASVLQAAAASDLVLITGGLGPTDDDLTRHALAGAASVPLELHAPSLEHLRAFFAARGREMPEANRVQAHAPRGATVLPNACGTAPGLRIEVAGTPCYALPGVPSEMRAMFTSEVLPGLRAASAGEILLTRCMHTCGLGESDIGTRIRDLMQRGRNPEVGTTAELGIVSIRVNIAARSRDEGAQGLAEMETELRRRLGDAVFGCDNDTLAGVVGAQLAATGCTVSTAESCTGGLVGKLLTDVAGSSRYYLGGVIAYANEVKMRLLGVSDDDLRVHGAVSEPVVLAMARGAARVFETDYGVAITGIAGPSGGSAEKPVGLIFIGLASPSTTVAWKWQLGSDSPREAIRVRTARMALNQLRLQFLRSGSAPR